MTHHPDVEVPRWTSTDHRPYVECAHDECSTRLRLDLTFPMTPESVYGELGAAGWTADPARCPAHRPDVYELMSEETRRAVVSWVVEQGRHLAGLEEWEMEDNFQTTEGTAEVYSKLVLPHEAKDAACNCGHSGHPEPPDPCDREPDCPAEEHAEDCATVRDFDEDQVYVNGSGDYCVHTEHGWQVVESGEMVVLFSPRNGRGGFDSQVSYQTPGHNAPWRPLSSPESKKARAVVETFNQAHHKAWARRARKATR